MADESYPMQDQSGAGPFQEAYFFNTEQTIVMKHYFGKFLRIDPEDETKLNEDGGTGKFARWNVEFDGNEDDLKVVKFKHNKTGKYLRIFRGGNTMDCKGNGGKFTRFKVHIQSDNSYKFEACFTKKKYPSVKPNKGPDVGGGGRFTQFTLWSENVDKEPEPEYNADQPQNEQKNEPEPEPEKSADEPQNEPEPEPEPQYDAQPEPEPEPEPEPQNDAYDEEQEKKRLEEEEQEKRRLEEEEQEKKRLEEEEQEKKRLEEERIRKEQEEQEKKRLKEEQEQKRLEEEERIRKEEEEKLKLMQMLEDEAQQKADEEAAEYAKKEEEERIRKEEERQKEIEEKKKREQEEDNEDAQGGDQSGINRFVTPFLFDESKTVIMQHYFGKTLRVKPDNEEQLNENGGSGKYARWIVELDGNDNDLNVVKFKHELTGNYLRIFGGGDKINVGGSGGKFTRFKVHVIADNSYKFESCQFEGRFVSVKKKGPSIGGGGKFTQFTLFTKEETPEPEPAYEVQIGFRFEMGSIIYNVISTEKYILCAQSKDVMNDSFPNEVVLESNQLRFVTEINDDEYDTRVKAYQSMQEQELEPVQIGLKFHMGDVVFSVKSADKYVVCSQFSDLMNEEFPNEIILERNQLQFVSVIDDNEYKQRVENYEKQKEVEVEIEVQIGLKFEMGNVVFSVKSADKYVVCVQSNDVLNSDFPNEILLERNQLQFVSVLDDDTYNERVESYKNREKENKSEAIYDDFKVEIGMKFKMGNVYYETKSIDKYIECKQIENIKKEQFPDMIYLEKNQLRFVTMIEDKDIPKKKKKKNKAQAMAAMFEKKEEVKKPQSPKPRKLRTSKIQKGNILAKYGGLNINPAALGPKGVKIMNKDKGGGKIDTNAKVQQATIRRGKRKKRKKIVIDADQMLTADDETNAKTAPALFYDEKAAAKAKKEKQKQKEKERKQQAKSNKSKKNNKSNTKKGETNQNSKSNSGGGSGKASAGGSKDTSDGQPPPQGGGSCCVVL